MCSTCYGKFRKYVLNNQPAKHSRLVNCKCGKLTRHFAFGMCESCYSQDWYIKNQDKRLKQERERKKTIPKKKRKEWQMKDYERVKNNPVEFHKQFIRKYTFRHKKEFIGKKCCEICSSNEDLQIHHMKYTKNRNFWKVVCYNCHNKIHRKYNKIKVVV